MKVLYFTDLHASESHSLGGANEPMTRPHSPHVKNRSLWQAARALDTDILHTARDVEPDVIVCGGDLYDHPNPTPNEEAVVIGGIRQLADVAPVHIVLGNHTQSHSGDATALASLEAAGNRWITVHSEPGSFQVGDVKFYTLPYPPIGSEPDGDDWTPEVRNGHISDGLASIVEHFANGAMRHDGPAVLLPHVTFSGAEYSAGRTVPSTDVSVPTERLPHFDATIAGHIHKRQRIGGLDERHMYVGPPTRWSFNDEGNPAGCCVVEFDDDDLVEWRWVETSALEFRTLSPAEAIDLDPVAQAEPHAMSVLRVKGEVSDLETLDDVEEAIDEIRTHAPCRNDVTVTQSDNRLDADDLESHSIRDIYDRFCEARPDEIPEDKRDDVFEVVEQLAQQTKEQ
ncbi:MAG: exonuclease SbcCD subunit D [Bradymonadaceae bacterium]